jgi:hypothetical protein
MTRSPFLGLPRRRRAPVAALALVLVVLAPVCRALCDPAGASMAHAPGAVAAEPCPGHAAMAATGGHEGAAEPGATDPAGAHDADCCETHDAAPAGPERPQADAPLFAVVAALPVPVLPVRPGVVRPSTDLVRAQGPPLLQRTLRFRE